MVSYASFTSSTSKYSHSEDMHAFPASFGFKREALSSISGIFLLVVVTKTHGKPNGFSKVLKDGKYLYLGIDDCRQNVRMISWITNSVLQLAPVINQTAC
ncbi:hypothetical protein H5410_008355 [Solanum commersonii]|uniref:Uncharacterized protein n=1 Tax=Solanum commersonii TaxID=4109 RepID=A0A9J6AFF3_SOLCO|nr:hypothetical protein H5410_008355 [Solanum commersonii]